MLVFNIKLRTDKTRINSRISAANTALLIRNVETRKFASLLAGQKGVYPLDSIEILCCPQLLSMSREICTCSLARKASTKSEKPAISWLYDIFVVEPSQFVKVAEIYTATVAPKEKIVSFLMANNGLNYRKITRINLFGNYDL